MLDQRDRKNITQPHRSSSSSLAPPTNPSSSFEVPITNKASCPHLEFPVHLPMVVLSFGLPISLLPTKYCVSVCIVGGVKNKDEAAMVVVSGGCGGGCEISGYAIFFFFQNYFLNSRLFEPHLVQAIQRFGADFFDLMPVFKFSDFRSYLDWMGSSCRFNWSNWLVRSGSL